MSSRLRIDRIRAPHVGPNKKPGPIDVSRLTHKKHGLAGSYGHIAWAKLRARCRTRQEALHEAWNDYAVFRKDMGPRPTGMNLVRLDESRPWEPGNVRWGRYNRKERRWE